MSLRKGNCKFTIVTLCGKQFPMSSCGMWVVLLMMMATNCLSFSLEYYVYLFCRDKSSRRRRRRVNDDDCLPCHVISITPFVWLWNPSWNLIFRLWCIQAVVSLQKKKRKKRQDDSSVSDESFSVDVPTRITTTTGSIRTRRGTSSSNRIIPSNVWQWIENSGWSGSGLKWWYFWPKYLW